MPRKAKSQWEFGELFPPQATRRVFTVSELTGQVRRLLEQQLGLVWVSGEITNRRAQSSGHIYFTLKDAAAQLNCVLFRREPVAHRELLEDGQKVILQGDLTVYEPRGQYQLIVHQAELQGVGALQLAFEKLKQKLQAEGLFAPERKRPLPRYPQRIGLVTSPTGAAIRDVLHVAQRRNPGLEIILAGCRVQGEGAAGEIAAAIALLNAYHQSVVARRQAPLDLILVTRGGGSLEDLWAFNEEVVARAMVASVVPIVSAIGHEIDFTISDFVADLRAATPSAAAELITEGAFASRQRLADATQRLPQLARQQVADLSDELTQLTQRLDRVHPRRQWQEQEQYLDDLQANLFRCVRRGVRERQVEWTHLRQRLNRLKPSVVLPQHQRALIELQRRLREQVRHGLEMLHNQQVQLAERLRLLAPENVLQRGYSITQDAASGEIIREAHAVRAGQKLKTRLSQGEVFSIVET